MTSIFQETCILYNFMVSNLLDLSVNPEEMRQNATKLHQNTPKLSHSLKYKVM